MTPYSSSPYRLLRLVAVFCLCVCVYLQQSASASTFAPTQEELSNIPNGFPGAAIDSSQFPHQVERGRTFVQIDDMRFPVLDGVDSAFTGTRWTNGNVYYVFDGAVTTAHRQAWQNAAADWSAVASLTFIEGTGSGNYILVQDSTVNNSFVGMIGGEQVMKIFNWSSEFIIAHEIGHALGAIHEHQRSGRDSFVQILTSNIQAGEEGNFTIRSSTNYGAYDFDSVMHYSKCAYSIDCPAGSSCSCTNYTISVLPPNDVQWQNAIGQRTHLSQLDQSGMAQRYGGSPTPTPPCGPVTVSGSITTADPTQTNRLNRGGTPSSCGVPNSCSVLAGTFHYRAHAFVNTSGTQQCVTATLTTTCSGANFIFAGAYLNSFDPASICTNYIGDPGVSPNGAPVSFGFNVPAGATFTIVVSEVTANSGCSGYSLNIAGLSCGGPTPTPAPSTTILGNISTRLRVETGNNVLIGGFIVTGTQGKRVIVRAIGPSLSLAGALPDPTLQLYDGGGGLIWFNDDWQVGSGFPNQQAEIVGTGIPPSHHLESAIMATLPANNSAYTAIVRGFDNATGVGLVEVYDLDRTVNSKLANISTRGFVSTGDNVMIGGTIIVGSNPARVLLRAIGPSLASAGVPDALSDTVLELRDGNGGQIASNDDWRFGGQEAEIIATGIPPTADLESAILVTLPANNAAYTAIVRGYNNLTGVALVEAYQLQ